jgi:glycosyltransferase involved in cell wall biosynthesis
VNFAILTDMYPKENDYYRNGFIHQRNLKYLELGYNCEVFVIKKDSDPVTYIYENVQVIEGNYEYIKKCLLDYNPDRILVHFINRKIMKIIQELNFSTKTLVWIHGFEALKWTRRVFNLDSMKFISYVLQNTIQMRALSAFIKKCNNCKFIFVSNWMKEIMEKDVGAKIKQYKIIPNPINMDLFRFNEKSVEQRKKILIIRSFDSRKYANDISIKAILKLKEKDYFKDLKFQIYGMGKYFKKLTNPLSGLENVELHEKFLSQSAIAELHREFGIFLCPTRQDSQGVSMCEAMSSGLVPISSNNTAIPEFLNPEAGYLTKNKSSDIVKAIEEMYFNEKLFLKKSFNSNRLIESKCKASKVIEDEMEYILGND